jgi:hypothetical protein
MDCTMSPYVKPEATTTTWAEGDEPEPESRIAPALSMFMVFKIMFEVAGTLRNRVSPETKKGAASRLVIVICARPLNGVLA